MAGIVLWRRIWLIFAQACTLALAVLALVQGLHPDWLGPARQAFSMRAAAARARPAVVSIQVWRPAGPHEDFAFPADAAGAAHENLGSGVIVDADGTLLTNDHLIAGADRLQVRLADGRKAGARVVGRDPDTDLAVLRIALPDLPVIALGDDAALRVGDAVLAIGYPFGMGLSVSQGVVGALGRNGLGINTYENFIQTDAAINPGNSGGALVDDQGRLVGINTAIFSRSGGSLGIGFAVPVSTVREVMRQIRAYGRVKTHGPGFGHRSLCRHGGPRAQVGSVAAGASSGRAA